jgi:hypothetical protein
MNGPILSGDSCAGQVQRASREAELSPLRRSGISKGEGLKSKTGSNSCFTKHLTMLEAKALNGEPSTRIVLLRSGAIAHVTR